MKKSMMLVVLLLALAACGVAAYAAATLGEGESGNPTVTYDAKENTFSDETDLFGDRIENMVPGDSISVPFDLKVENFTSSKAKEIAFKLETKGIYQITGEGVKEALSDELTEYLHLYVGDGDSLIAMKDGTADLGTFTSDGAKTISVWFAMDVEAGNEIASKNLQLDWDITATVDEKKSSGGGGGGGSDPVLNTADHFAYIVGYGDGTVKPDAPITRAEVATIFFRMLTDEARDKYWMETSPYSDVTAENWFNNAVSTLSNLGILTGYGDGTFRPNGSITRGEFATIAARFFDVKYTGADKFTDIADHWAREYINQAAEKGVVKGYEDNTFRPGKAITRAEAMALINRVLERNPKTVSDLLPTCAQWTDNQDTGKWYYIDVEEATTSHNYERKSDKTEKWISLREDPDWTQYEKVK